MTAPVATVARSSSMLPWWSVDTLSVTGEPAEDRDGRQWAVTSETGWSNSPSPRTQRTTRPFGHGDYRSAAFRGPRTVTLAGFVNCADAASREHTEHQLAALCSDPGRLYTYRRRTDEFDQIIDVELDDAPLVDVVNLHTLKWSFQFAASDPRKHDFNWREPRLRPPGPTVGGLDFSGGGLDFSGAGLDYGSPSSTSTVAQVGNYGTAPAHPLLRITGPLSAPAVLHRESGRALRYVDDIEPGETVDVNCDDFPARDVPAHAAISSVRGNVGTLLVREGRDWPVVEPQAVGSFQLRGYGNPSASVRVGLRSAWW